MSKRLRMSELQLADVLKKGHVRASNDSNKKDNKKNVSLIKHHDVTEISIVFPVEPMGKERARTVQKKGKRGKVVGSRTYTPKKTKDWSSQASKLARIKADEAGFIADHSVIEISIIAYFSIPSSWPDWKREMALRGDIVPTGKPDRDNVEKIVFDSLNGITWIDDSQASRGMAPKKLYSDRPRVVAFIRKHVDLIPSQVKTKKEAQEWLA